MPCVIRHKGTTIRDALGGNEQISVVYRRTTPLPVSVYGRRRVHILDGEVANAQRRAHIFKGMRQ